MNTKGGCKRLGVALAGIMTAGLVVGICFFRGSALMATMARVWLLPLLASILTMTALSVRPTMRRENLFLPLSLGLGVGYMLMITPLAVPDEWFHYEVVLTMAAGCSMGSVLLTQAIGQPTV